MLHFLYIPASVPRYIATNYTILLCGSRMLVTSLPSRHYFGDHIEISAICLRIDFNALK
jgi:hypothetical protein